MAAPDDSAEDLYDHAPCGYLSTGLDGTITKINQTLLDWLGYQRADLVARKTFQSLLTVGGRIYYETHYRPLLSMQGSVREIAVDLLRHDGSRLPALVNASVAAGLIRTTVFDATARREYERELLAARRAAERSEQRLSVLQQLTSALAEPLDAKQVAATAVAHLVANTDFDQVSIEPEDADADARTAFSLRGGGTLLVGRSAGPVPTPDECAFLETVAAQCDAALERASLHLENARLFERERHNALILQRGLLAEAPSNDPRITVGTYYHPAGDGLEVGGDWYDVFPVGPDRVALVVGDVVGRGIDAASAMGQLRSAIRALAATDSAPAGVLERLDRFVDRFEAGRMSTVVYGELDLITGRLRYACAGHLPPLLVEPGGTHRFLWGGRSASLAAYAGSRTRAEDEVDLRRGARLLLYTDGLVERRGRNLLDTIARLGVEAGARQRFPLAGLLPELASLLVEGNSDDDVCILAVAFGTEPEFDRVVSADLSQLRNVRGDFRRWLATFTLTVDEREALLLACSEAVANAIEHGYRNDGLGTVRVRAAVLDGEVELVVSDQGAWREPRAGTDRGRGIAMIKALMDRVFVERGAGTVVTMRRRIAAEGKAA